MLAGCQALSRAAKLHLNGCRQGDGSGPSFDQPRASAAKPAIGDTRDGHADLLIWDVSAVSRFNSRIGTDVVG